jgi:hypothetical protein
MLKRLEQAALLITNTLLSNDGVQFVAVQGFTVAQLNEQSPEQRHAQLTPLSKG